MQFLDLTTTRLRSESETSQTKLAAFKSLVTEIEITRRDGKREKINKDLGCNVCVSNLFIGLHFQYQPFSSKVLLNKETVVTWQT